MTNTLCTKRQLNAYSWLDSNHVSTAQTVTVIPQSCLVRNLIFTLGAVWVAGCASTEAGTRIAYAVSGTGCSLIQLLLVFE